VKGYAFPRQGMEAGNGNYPRARARVLRTTADLHLAWDVPYEPGTLKSRGTKDGKVVATVEVFDSGRAGHDRLAVDRMRSRPTVRDVAHITVQFQDATGRMAPTAGQRGGVRARTARGRSSGSTTETR